MLGLLNSRRIQGLGLSAACDTAPFFIQLGFGVSGLGLSSTFNAPSF